eukprot:TRINITY_DN6818_c0_g1_i1.p1 TRINITY_DN6818_c0_g1~~TRINITY_DN6818_c0_g1_i1.p1  ORF type:complete len:647 (-),score=95.84 TRINITY_DN6818_c0_g1_i1:1847-3724(-)
MYSPLEDDDGYDTGKDKERLSRFASGSDSETSLMGQKSDETIVVPLEVEDEESSSMGADRPDGKWAMFKWRVSRCFFPPKVYHARTVNINNGEVQVVSDETSLPANTVRNHKYTLFTFLPMVLYEQFKFFFNMYFLMVALSQFIPALKVGYLFTYVAPLGFVLSVTMAKEAYDDFQRWKRDMEANSKKFSKLKSDGTYESIRSADICVGDFIKLEKNERVPADMILVRTTEKGGATFIRTDQLDGETDWKLRKAVMTCNNLADDKSLLQMQASFFANKPKKDIYDFVGNFIFNNQGKEDVEPLTVENTLWMNTVVASGTVIGLVVYAGTETRSAMNTNQAKTKVGLLDMELNTLSKVLFSVLVSLSFLMVALNGFKAGWHIDMFRFILLFSAIIPISLRVNLDMSKTLYSYWIMNDPIIEGTIVRTSTIPEELGRISYLLSDKTGTLTQNDMIFKRLHLGSNMFSRETVDEIQGALKRSYETGKKTDEESLFSKNRFKKAPVEEEVRRIIEALALCNNVTPTYDTPDQIVYQASSPDEIALVKFTESIGLTLSHRDMSTMTLTDPYGGKTTYNILESFPFSSETKRMGIILENQATGQMTFYIKGADVVMSKIVKHSRQKGWVSF